MTPSPAVSCFAGTRAWGVACVLGALLSACGGGGGGSDTTAVAATPSSPASATPTTPATVTPTSPVTTTSTTPATTTTTTTATTATGSTAGVQCGYSYSAFNSTTSVRATSTVSWSCSSTRRALAGNGLPDHDVGAFPNANNPNTIAAQNVNASMVLVPVPTATIAARGLGPVGYALNGVKFDPSTAGSCTVNGASTSCSLIGNTGVWSIEALGQSSFNFGVDSSNAHVQPDGAYHYHGMPEGLVSKQAKGQNMTLVGFALDGYPVYARYGYTVAGSATSGVKVIKGSYQLKATADAGRPSVATYPMGAFTQDYQYVAGSGDLDECNGRTGVTPEFPAGIYHYIITDTYPYIGRCLRGAVN